MTVVGCIFLLMTIGTDWWAAARIRASPSPTSHALRAPRAVEEKGTPQVMLSGEETDDGENITAEYCSLDGSGKRVKAKRT